MRASDDRTSRRGTRLQRVLERPRAFWWLMGPLSAFLAAVGVAATLALSANSVTRLQQIQLLGLEGTGRQLRDELARHVDELDGLVGDPALPPLLHADAGAAALNAHLLEAFRETLRRAPRVRSLTWIDETGRARLGLAAVHSGPPVPRLPGADAVDAAHAAAQRLGAREVAMLDARAPFGPVGLGGSAQVVPVVVSLVHLDTHPHGAVLAELDARVFFDKLAGEDVFGSRTGLAAGTGRWLRGLDEGRGAPPAPGEAALWERLREPRGTWRDGTTLWAWARVELAAAPADGQRAALAAAPDWIAVSRVAPQVMWRIGLSHAVLVLPVVAALLVVLGLALRALVDHAQRLARTQRNLDLANRDAGIGLWSLDLLDHHVTLSAFSRDLHGSRTMPMAEFLAMVPDAGQRARLTQAIDEAIGSDGPRQAEVQILMPDGSRVWRRLVGHRECEDGIAVRLAGTAQDITSLKQRELELADERARLIDVVDGTQAGLWTWSIESGSVRLNDYYAGLLGLQPGEGGDRETDFTTWVRHVHPDDADGAMTLARECLEGRSPTFETQMRVIDTRGTVLWVHNRAKVTRRDAEGRPLLMAGVVTNVTDLVTARHQAEAASQAKSEFLSTMSHELRTPLNAILGFGQLLSIDHALPPAQRDNVDEILRAGQHLLDLINDVLDLSRIESGRMPLQIAPVGLDALTQGCVAFVAPMAQARGIRVHVQVDPGLTVMADATRLRQVLVNLLSNAVKYNHQGGEVAVSAGAVGGRLSLTVADTGPGIAEADRATLFQPFQRGAAAAGVVPGTGIGLSLSRGLLQRMGGDLRLDSPPGQGCVFHLGLPLAPAPTGPVPLDEPAAPRAGTPADTTATPPAGVDVLCVDDNPANLKLLERMLASREDLRVRTAASAGLAMLLVRERRPDLVLTDLHMPGTDGFALLRRLRADPAIATIPVVAVSASAMSAEVDRGLRAGFDDYLTKPLDLERVLATVARLTGPRG